MAIIRSKRGVTYDTGRMTEQEMRDAYRILDAENDPDTSLKMQNEVCRAIYRSRGDEWPHS